MTVPTETRPPVPGCLVIVKLPSSNISAIGYPTFLKLGIFGLVGKDGKKIVTTEVNKANNNLH